VKWGSKCINAEHGDKIKPVKSCGEGKVKWGSKCINAEHGDTERRVGGRRSVSIKITINRGRNTIQSRRLASGLNKARGSIRAARNFCNSPKARGKNIRVCMVIQALEKAGVTSSDDSEEDTVAEEADSLARDAGSDDTENIEQNAVPEKEDEDARDEASDVKDLDLADLISQI